MNVSRTSRSTLAKFVPVSHGFFDDASRQYVSLDQILRDFISAAHQTIKEFETNIRPTSQST